MATIQSSSNLYKERGSLTLKYPLYLFLIMLCLDYMLAEPLASGIGLFLLHCEITGCGKWRCCGRRQYCDKLTVYKVAHKQHGDSVLVM